LRVSEQVNAAVPESLRSEIRDFIATAFKGRLLEDEEDIFATGFVNSLFAMELVTFIEKTFGITVESEDLDLDNFRSVERLAGFVARKTNGRAGTASAPA
jgi:acyl carrier protein